MSKLKDLQSLLLFSWDDKRQRERFMDSGSQKRISKQSKMDPKKQCLDLFITFCRWNFS